MAVAKQGDDLDVISSVCRTLSRLWVERCSEVLLTSAAVAKETISNNKHRVAMTEDVIECCVASVNVPKEKNNIIPVKSGEISIDRLKLNSHSLFLRA